MSNSGRFTTEGEGHAAALVEVERLTTYAEEALIKRVSQVVGYVPVGLKDLLHVLKHPDVIELTRSYIETTTAGGES